MSRSDGLLFAALAREAECNMGKLNAQELANTAWAFATVDRSEGLLFAMLARAVEQRVEEFNS